MKIQVIFHFFRYRDKFDEIARDQSHIFLKNNQELFDEEITKLIHTFENTSVQKLLRDDSTPPDKKACVVCQSTPAKNRCSRCHSERYCSRKCQLKHWPKHKGICSQRMTDYQSKNEGAMAKIEEILATWNSTDAFDITLKSLKMSCHSLFECW